MRRRSPSYSPPRRGYGGRDRSPPPRGRYGGYKEASCGLLVRNIPKGSRPEDLRVPFEQFGRVRDVYLPRDYYTGEPRGFGFVQYLNPFDAAEAKKYMDRRMFNGREITVVFAEENRKKPEEMRMKERGRGRASYGNRRSPNRGYTPSRSPPRNHSPSPRKGRYSRSNENATRRERYESMSPPHRGRGLSPRSPAEQVRGREQFRDDIPDASPVGNGQGRLDRRHGRRSDSAERPYSPRPKDGLLKSPSKQDRLRSPSPSMSPPPQPQRYSRSRSKSWRESRSPSSRSPPPRRQRHSGHSNTRDLGDPGLKSYPSRVPAEERSL